MGALIEPDPKAPLSNLASGATSTAQKPPSKRALSDSELVAARKVFDAGLKYTSVSVEKMGGFTELINGSRAYTFGNTVNLPGKAYAYPHQYVSVVIHELVHVWQYQHGGWGYIPNALWSQTVGDGYDVSKALRQGKPWKKMNPEQQAQMIQDSFRNGFFETPGSLFGLYNNKSSVVRAGTKPPDGFTDYTSTLVEALAVLRKG